MTNMLYILAYILAEVHVVYPTLNHPAICLIH